MMEYVLYGLAAAYLIFGAVLTHSVIAGMHRRRGSIRDWVLGSVSMPVLFVLGLLLIAFEKAWARLMKILDLEPPEEMRAGPAEPAPEKSGSRDRR